MGRHPNVPGGGGWGQMVGYLGILPIDDIYIILYYIQISKCYQNYMWRCIPKIHIHNINNTVPTSELSCNHTYCSKP